MSMQPQAVWHFEAVLVLLSGLWPPRGLVSGCWPPGSASPEQAGWALALRKMRHMSHVLDALAQLVYVWCSTTHSAAVKLASSLLIRQVF